MARSDTVYASDGLVPTLLSLTRGWGNGCIETWSSGEHRSTVPPSERSQDEKEVSETVRPPAETSDSKRTVLVADDDGAVRKTVADVLNLAGYDVIQSADGEEALQALRPGVDVVILDMHLPKREGLSVLDALGPSPPKVIVCSAFAYDRPEDIERVGLGGKVFRCLRKPVPPVGLLSAVADAIDELDRGQ